MRKFLILLLLGFVCAQIASAQAKKPTIMVGTVAK